MFWSNLISKLTHKRSLMQNLCGRIIQIFHSLMLQQCSNKDKDNIEASQSIDSNNFGLNTWNDVDKQGLKTKYTQEMTLHNAKK